MNGVDVGLQGVIIWLLTAVIYAVVKYSGKSLQESTQKKIGTSIAILAGLATVAIGNAIGQVDVNLVSYGIECAVSLLTAWGIHFGLYGNAVSGAVENKIGIEPRKINGSENKPD